MFFIVVYIPYVSRFIYGSFVAPSSTALGCWCCYPLCMIITAFMVMYYLGVNELLGRTVITNLSLQFLILDRYSNLAMGRLQLIMLL